jgi:hypothetical protein
MGGMAEFERKLIRARCDEGIRRAKARGTVFGRKSVLDACERRKIAERYAAGETIAALAREYKVGEATVWKALRAGSAATAQECRGRKNVAEKFREDGRAADFSCTGGGRRGVLRVRGPADRHAHGVVLEALEEPHQ